MINYVLGSLCPQYYCFILPTAFPTNPLPLGATAYPASSNEENAEIIQGPGLGDV